MEENGGSIEVCATILNPNGCTAPTEIPFLLDVRTSDDSAGMYRIVSYHCCLVYLLTTLQRIFLSLCLSL